MAKIEVKLSTTLTTRFGPGGWGKRYDEAFTAALIEVAKVVRQNWISIASQTLKTSYPDYARGIPAPSDWIVTPYRVEMVLTGWLANAVERGISAYDMKTFLLKSPHVKRTKDGKPFIDIPFRHGTPTATGVMFPAMPEHIYDLAKKLSATRTIPKVPLASKGKTGLVSVKWGGRLPKAPPIMSKLTKGKAVQTASGTTKILKRDYTHVASIYGGMFRDSKKYAKKTGTTYYTIRRISLASDEASWIHPGIKARHIAKKAVSAAKPHINGIVRKHLKRKGVY